MRESGFGTMGKDIRRKLRNDNDGKILVVGKNSETGIGKTTFAIQLCRFLDSTSDDWRAEEKAHIDIDEYIEAHMTRNKGSCLLLDEIEAGADSRRAMSNQNVHLSQAWATMRAQNIATVATLPSVSMLDNRMLELADYWVLVKQRGLAQPYKVVVNDFNGRVQRKAINPTKKGQPETGEHIQFTDLPGDDPDKKYLDSIKDDTVWDLTNDAKKLSASEHKKKKKKAVEDARREKRNEMIRDFYENTDLSTTDLSEFESVGVSQSQVSEIV
jgi:hypothetical protein